MGVFIKPVICSNTKYISDIVSNNSVLSEFIYVYNNINELDIKKLLHICNKKYSEDIYNSLQTYLISNRYWKNISLNSTIFI